MDERKKLKKSKSDESEKKDKKKLSRSKSLKDTFFGKKAKVGGKEVQQEFDIDDVTKKIKGIPAEKKQALNALLENDKMWAAFEKACKNFYIQENLDFFKDYHHATREKEPFDQLSKLYDNSIKTNSVNIYSADKTELDDNRNATTKEDKAKFIAGFESLVNTTKSEFLADLTKKTNFISNVERELKEAQAEKKHGKKK